MGDTIVLLHYHWVGRALRIGFCHLLSPLTRYMRAAFSCRVLQWIDDYLVVPRTGATPNTAEDCQELSTLLDALFPRLGMMRHPGKGVWGGLELLY